MYKSRVSIDAPYKRYRQCEKLLSWMNANIYKFTALNHSMINTNSAHTSPLSLLYRQQNYEIMRYRDKL